MTGSTTLTRERADLIESLRRHRSFLRFTVRDLTDEQALRRPTVSALTLAGLIDTSAVEILTGRTASRPLGEVYGYEPGWGLPSAADQAAIIELMTGSAPQGGSAPPSATAAG